MILHKLTTIRHKRRFMYGTSSVWLIIFSSLFSPHSTGAHDFENPRLSTQSRVADLISRMKTLDKISQLSSSCPALPEFGIKAYEYQNEALHGVVAGGVTVFPQAIALSSTWDTLLEYKIAVAISDEARALNNQNGKGLTYWSPTVNMSRDPRWGRNEETYGEDVFLAKKFIVNFIHGMQGDNPAYLKTIATVKHFACNNVEYNRFGTSSNVDERSLREYFLPVFKAAVTDARVGSVMSAYNALNDIPCTADYQLLTGILRKEWGFSGYVVSDCGAVPYICKDHHYVSSYPEAVVAAIKAGCDLCCGPTYQQYLPLALADGTGFLTQTDIDTALSRLFSARVRLGEFDPPGSVSYTAIPASTINSQDHQTLALQAAKEAIVLLKNDGAILPLSDTSLTSVAVIGPNANVCQFGGYSGGPVSSITPLKGIQNRFNGTVNYAAGCSITGPEDPAAFNEAVAIAKTSDAAILFMGVDNNYVQEDHDLNSLDLPGAQLELIKAVFQANPRTIVVLVNGNPLSITWVQRNIPGIIEAWYDGQAEGEAIAAVLFGDVNPGGKLTSTWVSSENELPSMNDYTIFNNRTYMYYNGTPLYPFGHGLSYTTFLLSNLQIAPATIKPGDTASITVDIKNIGARSGDEVVQLYVHDRGPSVKKAAKQLKGFQRITLNSGETGTLTFRLPYEELEFWDVVSHSFKVENGNFDVFIGASSADMAVTGQITAAPGPIALGKMSSAASTSISSIAQDRFQFTFSGKGRHEIRVYAINGRVVFSYENIGSGICNWRPPSPGVYLMKLTEENQCRIAPLMVTR
jgi:beta-glucosidase